MKTPFSPIRRISIVHLLVFIMLSLQLGCSTYLRVKDLPAEKLTPLQKGKKLPKHFVLHAGERVYTIRNLSMDSENLYGYLSLPTEFIYYKKGRPNLLDPREIEILQEVHIYLYADNPQLKRGFVNIPLSDLKEIKVCKKSGTKTTVSYIAGFIGGTALLFLAVLWEEWLES